MSLRGVGGRWRGRGVERLFLLTTLFYTYVSCTRVHMRRQLPGDGANFTLAATGAQTGVCCSIGSTLIVGESTRLFTHSVRVIANRGPRLVRGERETGTLIVIKAVRGGR